MFFLLTYEAGTQILTRPISEFSKFSKLIFHWFNLMPCMELNNNIPRGFSAKLYFYLQVLIKILGHVRILGTSINQGLLIKKKILLQKN